MGVIIGRTSSDDSVLLAHELLLSRVKIETLLHLVEVSGGFGHKGVA